MQSKLPGAALRVEPVKMDFQYGASFGKASPEAYERLLHDAMTGDPTLFARRDEVEEAWVFVDTIEQRMARRRPMARTHGRRHRASRRPARSANIPAGSWGLEGGRRTARAGRPHLAAVLTRGRLNHPEDEMRKKLPLFRILMSETAVVRLPHLTRMATGTACSFAERRAVRKAAGEERGYIYTASVYAERTGNAQPALSLVHCTMDSAAERFGAKYSDERALASRGGSAERGDRGDHAICTPGYQVAGRGRNGQCCCGDACELATVSPPTTTWLAKT